MRLAALLLVLAALAAAACGGDDADSSVGASPEAWAADVCGSLTEWARDLRTRSEALPQEMEQAATSGGLEEARRFLVEFLEESTSGTEMLVSEVRAAGAPDVEDGEELADTFTETLEEVERDFAAARDRAEGLSVDDPQAFGTEAVEIGTSLQDTGRRAEQSFDGLADQFQNEELDEAFESEPACRELDTVFE